MHHHLHHHPHDDHQDGGDRLHHRASVKPLNLVHYTGSDRLAEVIISIIITSIIIIVMIMISIIINNMLTKIAKLNRELAIDKNL